MFQLHFLLEKVVLLICLISYLIPEVTKYLYILFCNQHLIINNAICILTYNVQVIHIVGILLINKIYLKGVYNVSH